MASLPTGSNKILEVQSGNIYVVIKAKNLHPNLTNESITKQSSANPHACVHAQSLSHV